MKKRITIAATALAALAFTATAAFGASATSSATLPTLSLTMAGKSITATPTVAAGAVNVVSTVSGAPVAAPALVHLEPGVTFQQALAVAGRAHGQLDALQGYAEIVYAGQAAKGTSTAQTVLKPGNYVAINENGNNPTKFPYTPFTVTAGTGAALPAAGATIDMLEFAFKGPSTLHDGQVLRIVNTGYLYHMAIALPVKDKADATKVATGLKTGEGGKALQKLIAGQPVALNNTTAPGTVQQAKLSLKPGYYVMACFMATGDGREHTLLGMEKVVKVVK